LIHLRRKQSKFWPFLGLLILCSIGLGVNGLSAQAGRAGSFLRMGMGARAKAMGGAYSAVARGVESNFYNPAGLPRLEKKEILLSYRFLSLDRQFSALGIAMPVRPKVSSSGKSAINGGISLAWIRAGVDDIEGRTSDGVKFNNDLSNSENAFIFSFGLLPVSNLSVGLTVKVLWNRFPDLGVENKTVSAKGVGFDFGLLYRFSEDVFFSAVVKEANNQYKWSTQDLYDLDGTDSIEPLPKVSRFGVFAKVPRLKKLWFSIDLEQIFRESFLKDRMDQRVHVGLESMLVENIALRAGYDDGSITAGAGYRFPLFGKLGELNYAYVSPGENPDEEHVFSWFVNF